MTAWLRWRRELPIESVESMPHETAQHFRYLTGKYGKESLDAVNDQHNAALAAMNP